MQKCILVLCVGYIKVGRTKNWVLFYRVVNKTKFYLKKPILASFDTMAAFQLVLKSLNLLNF
jgi:hypothetical protein